MNPFISGKQKTSKLGRQSRDSQRLPEKKIFYNFSTKMYEKNTLHDSGTMTKSESSGF